MRYTTKERDEQINRTLKCRLSYDDAVALRRIANTSHDLLLRELKSAIFYIETYGGEVTRSFASGGNLDAVKALIAKSEKDAKERE